MRRTTAVASALVLGGALAPAVGPAPAQAVTTRPALVVNRDFPDPDVTLRLQYLSRWAELDYVEVA